MKLDKKKKFTDLEVQFIKTFINNADITLPIYWNLDENGKIWLNEEEIRNELECHIETLQELVSKQNHKIKKLMLKYSVL